MSTSPCVAARIERPAQEPEDSTMPSCVCGRRGFRGGLRVVYSAPFMRLNCSRESMAHGMSCAVGDHKPQCQLSLHTCRHAPWLARTTAPGQVDVPSRCSAPFRWQPARCGSRIYEQLYICGRCISLFKRLDAEIRSAKSMAVRFEVEPAANDMCRDGLALTLQAIACATREDINVPADYPAERPVQLCVTGQVL